jgi:hypothetical protein
VARGTHNSNPQKCDRADGSGEVRFAPKADMPLHRSEVMRCAKRRHSRCSKQQHYSITSSARASNIGGNEFIGCLS